MEAVPAAVVLIILAVGELVEGLIAVEPLQGEDHVISHEDEGYEQASDPDLIREPFDPDESDLALIQTQEGFEFSWFWDEVRVDGNHGFVGVGVNCR